MRPRQLLVVHLGIFQLFVEGRPELSCTLKMDGITRLFRGVNILWKTAGIEWRPRSVVPWRISGTQAESIASADNRSDLRRALVASSPGTSELIASRLWRLCLMRSLPIRAGGVYTPNTSSVYCAEFTPRGDLGSCILAHELGHSLGLRHVERQVNLMNPDALKSIHLQIDADVAEISAIHHLDILDEAQVERARRQVACGPFRGHYDD